MQGNNLDEWIVNARVPDSSTSITSALPRRHARISAVSPSSGLSISMSMPRFSMPRTCQQRHVTREAGGPAHLLRRAIVADTKEKLSLVLGLRGATRHLALSMCDAVHKETTSSQPDADEAPTEENRTGKRNQSLRGWQALLPNRKRHASRNALVDADDCSGIAQLHEIELPR